MSMAEEQKMASLPKDRIIPDEPPFNRVCVDYFGPFKVKRSRLKRHNVIFTCLASGSVHLDVAESLDTDSYIKALRRFIGRRGQVKRICADNGTNFIGTERELTRSIQEWNQFQIQSAILQKNVDWKINLPAGSNHIGTWERINRSICNANNSVLEGLVLDDECIRTLLCEI